MTLDSDCRSRLSHPTSELRCACLTLQRTSPADIRSIYLLLPLRDLPLPASSAVALAERIAAAYGLAAQAQTDERSLKVWLSRTPPSEDSDRNPPEMSIAVTTSPSAMPEASGEPTISEGESCQGEERERAVTHGVLIADEEAGLRRLIADTLTRHGFCAREARTGQETLSAIQELRPDLLLLDINLPDRSGWDVLRELRRREVVVPTIVVSAGRVVPCRLEEFRPLAYLPKPYPLEALLRLVADHGKSGQSRRYVSGAW